MLLLFECFDHRQLAAFLNWHVGWLVFCRMVEDGLILDLFQVLVVLVNLSSPHDFKLLPWTPSVFVNFLKRFQCSDVLLKWLEGCNTAVMVVMVMRVHNVDWHHDRLRLGLGL